MKHLILLGCGYAHLQLLQSLAKEPMAGVQITLISPHPRQLYFAMMPSFVAGYATLDDCTIALQPLLQNTSVQWLQQSACALDANARTLTLDDGSTHGYDVLSVNCGTTQDRQQIERTLPGARKHALFVRPFETFGMLWPQVLELGQQRPLRVSVIGAGLAGIELAFAVARHLPNASVTLVCGPQLPACHTPAAFQQRILKTLQRRHITVLQETALSIDAEQVSLSNGARLLCDVPILASAGQAPAWLQTSALALDDSGFIAVDALQRSSSHAQVFAAGDVSSRADCTQPHNGFHATQTGAALVRNVRAQLAGIAPTPYTPLEQKLLLLACGKRSAIASWGEHSAQGFWVWWLKKWLDQRAIKDLRSR